MPISVTCPACQHTLKVKDEYAGKKGKCPKCQALMPIPGPSISGTRLPQPAAPKPAATAASPAAKAAPQPAAPAAPPAPAKPAAPPAKSRDQLRTEILAAFHGTLQPPKVSFGQKLGTVIIMLLLFLLPISYFAIVTGLSAGLLWIFLNGESLQLSGPILWLILIGGLFVLLCLLKPLLEPRRKLVKRYPISKEKEKLLTDVVGKVCQLLDAPLPTDIVLECSTRLAAEYRGGIFGLLRRDVVLTVGLPILASLTVEQFAGLVAGQMAQYRRHAGCRTTNMIRAINGWLWRSVCDDGRFDDWLKRSASRPGMHAGKLLFPLRGIKLVAQAVLFVPMFIGNTLASSIVRRTELDGDRCHARLAGGTSFAEVVPRVRIIDYTWQGILTELVFRHKDQSLPDSLPQQLQLQMVDMTPDICAVLLESVVKPEEKPYDSRPSDADRLAATGQESPSGALDCSVPAHELLADYPAQAKAMTWDYYVATFGSQLLRTALKKVG